jgi:hypothetical protein
VYHLAPLYFTVEPERISEKINRISEKINHITHLGENIERTAVKKKQKNCRKVEVDCTSDNLLKGT